MPTKEETENEVTVDPRDVAIEQLNDEIYDLRNELAIAQKDVEKLEKKLTASKAAPTGDVVYLGGVSYPVLSTHRADNTFAEVKRGHVGEGLTLVAIDKIH